MSKTVDATFRGQSDAVFAAGRPAAAAVALRLGKDCSWLYESLSGQPVPGAAAATAPAHDHTGGDTLGAGTGAPIPRELLAECWRMPEYDDSAAAAPDNVVLSGYATAGTSNVDTLPRTMYATKCTDTTTWQVLAVEHLRVRAGAIGVQVLLWRGVDLAGAPLNEVTARVELVDPALGTVIDYASVTYSADANAAWEDYTSGGALDVTAAGTMLTADTTLELRICAKPDDTTTDASVFYLFGAAAYEVVS